MSTSPGDAGGRCHRIGVMGGDGAGPELIEQGVRLLETVAALDGITIEFAAYPHDAQFTEAGGERISGATIDEIGALDALLFGAQGGPSDGSDVVAERPLMAITNRLDLSVGVRSARLYADRLSPLRNARGPVDILVVRDTSEDCYAVPGGVAHSGHPHEVSLGLLVYTRTAIDRVLEYALMAATRRRRLLHVVTQVEGVPAHRIWHERLEELSPRFPDVEVVALLPDTAASRMVDNPAGFDVVATTYWLGGLLSNLMATVVGGVALVPSARINPERHFGLFEPSHGTVSRHAGRRVASPVATLRAAAMLMAFLGESHAAERIEAAIAAALVSGRLPDVTARSGLSTDEATSVVIDELVRMP